MEKKSILILISTVLVSCLLVNADFYEIDYKCKDDICIGGEPISWNITIYNQGERKIEIIALHLIDAMNGSVLAYFNTSFNPHTDARGDLITIGALQQKTISLHSRLPKANNISSLKYYLCFTNAVFEQLYAMEDIYSLEYCYEDRIEEVPYFECKDSTKCKIDEYCRNNKCSKLKCKSCTFPSNHICMPYECCNSSMCSIGQNCRNNKCQDLNCDYDEYTFNHSCKKLNCTEYEGYFNNSCTKLSCNYDEGYFNHTCTKLDCREGEVVINNTCIFLNCSTDETISNNSCIKLDCLFNESAINHRCSPLTCNFFQKYGNNECLTNKPLIAKVSIEILVISVIIVLLISDVRKYIVKRKKIKQASIEDKKKEADEEQIIEKATEEKTDESI